MKVMKFGGTSVGSPQRIKDVAALVGDKGKNIVVLSAMSGTTNSLIEISKAVKEGDPQLACRLISSLEERYKGVVDELFSTEEWRKTASEKTAVFFNDIRHTISSPDSPLLEKEIVARGELISTNLMHAYLQEQGVASVLLPALSFMRTDEQGEPDLPYITKHIAALIEDNPDAALFITQGFICLDHNGEISNLERGGSDYTASLIGAAVNADEIEIWTDIDGMHNNDPRFVEGTRPVRNLHFEEAAELAYFGAKILHPTCIQPAKLNNIPVRLLNTMQPEAPGTLIDNVLRRGYIKAVAAKDNITAIKIKSGRMLLAYGFLKKVFEIFEKHETAIDMITTSEVGVSLTIDNERNLDRIVEELHRFGTVTIDRDMTIICVVGDLEWQNRGFEAKALDALRDIPVRMISYGGSNYNISFLIKAEDKNRALKALSAEIFE
ncbi:MAG: aspartate kinase [Muribaculaceae bacterium]|nr:aspartate kinase [Muribaculaceae bacterium]